MSYFQAAAAGMQSVSDLTQGLGQARQYGQAAEQASASAETSRLQSNANEETLRRRQAIELGNVRAAAAESGFDASSGSLLDLQKRSAAETELDIMTQRYKGQLQTIGYENEASSLRASSKNARKGAYLSVFGTLGKAAGNYYGQKSISDFNKTQG